MQDDDAYDMSTGNWRALRGRYPDHVLEEWRLRIGAPDQPTPERQAELDWFKALMADVAKPDSE